MNKIQDAITAPGTYLAGGTDYMDRVRHHLIGEDAIDLNGISELEGIETDGEGNTYIGSLTTIFNLAQTPYIQTHYAAIAEAAGGLATPQIRMVGTVGGSLTQATRCLYYRHPNLECTKKLDPTCGGREGYHPHGIIFDTGGCVHPHPSTLGMAFMAYDAGIEINGSERRPLTALYGDGSDHSRDHLLKDGELITKIILPPSPESEKATYFRAAARERAEWALVECVARLHLSGNKIEKAFIGVGGVATVPLRLPKVENALVGQPATEETFAHAASFAAEGANPLPQTAYKVPLLINSVEETLLRAVGDVG